LGWRASFAAVAAVAAVGGVAFAILAWFVPRDNGKATLIPLRQPHTTQGSGHTVCMATESAAMPLSDLQQMLNRLQVALSPQLIHI